MSGKSCRKEISIVELIEMSPNDEAAEKWFEKERWGKDRTQTIFQVKWEMVGMEETMGLSTTGLKN